jgi:hypothetical protein
MYNAKKTFREMDIKSLPGIKTIDIHFVKPFSINLPMMMMVMIIIIIIIIIII